jgi:hypothetical protein
MLMSPDPLAEARNDPAADPAPAKPRARKSARAAADAAPSENPDRGSAGAESADQPSTASFSMGSRPTSRAIDFTWSEEETTSKCAAAGVAISAIEPLPRGGTHLVCSTSDGAAVLRRLHAKAILVGPQKRSPFFVPALQRQ